MYPLFAAVLLLVPLLLGAVPKAEPVKASPPTPPDYPAQPLPVVDKQGRRILDWLELLTPADYKTMMETPPAPIDHGTGDTVAPDPLQQLQQQPALSQAASSVATTRTVASLNGLKVRLPGFVVPLETAANGDLTEFFLVPYFGACIHVPPPPANQIVYIKLDKARAFDNMYVPYWVEGVLQTQTTHNKLANAAYSMQASKIEPYHE